MLPILLVERLHAEGCYKEFVHARRRLAVNCLKFMLLVNLWGWIDAYM